MCARSQNSFHYFRTVEICATFGLLAVAAFLDSLNMPIADRIRGESLIVVKDDDLLSRLHALGSHVGNIHQIITKSINRTVYTLYKTFQ